MLVSSGQQNFIPRVFKSEEGHIIQKGDHARLSAFIGAIAIADLIKTTLGPKGMDKMLVAGRPNTGDMSGNVIVTNDGATILKRIPVDNAAAKILINISMTQDDEVGDGTSSVVVLAGELLREAEKLVIMRKIHPTTVINGWRKAIKISNKELIKIAKSNKNDSIQFKKDLLNIARTTLSSKIVSNEINFFSELCVKAVLRLKGSIDLDMIQIVKKQGGKMLDSFLDDGFILDKAFGLTQKKDYNKPKIMVCNSGMDTDKIKIWGAKVKVHSLLEMSDIERAEKQKMKIKINKILKYKPDIVINRQLIYDYPEELFTQAGVGSIEHADFDGVERLARVLGAEIMSTFDDFGSDFKGDFGDDDDDDDDDDDETDTKIDNKPETKEDIEIFNKATKSLGTCDKVEEMIIGEDTVIRFCGVPKGEACTIVLRGGSTHLLDEMERSIHDALCVLTQTIHESRIVLGGGACEMMMADAVSKTSSKHGGKEALAMDAFANALRQIPNILADNAGLDAADICTNLRAYHAKGEHFMGVDMVNGGCGDMRKLGVYESFKSKSQSLTSAHEAAEMILRVDDIVKCAPRKREAPR